MASIRAMKFRKHIRLKDFDYATDGYYFVTICTEHRKKMFKPRISQKYRHKLPEDAVAGSLPIEHEKNTNILESNILDIEKKFPAEIDFYCIMPEHIHMIIVLIARHGRAATNIENKCSRLPMASQNNTSLPWIINAFKGWCTRSFGKKIFQPNYYEHIIRNETALDKIRKYIENNPFDEQLNWSELDTM